MGKQGSGHATYGGDRELDIELDHDSDSSGGSSFDSDSDVVLAFFWLVSVDLLWSYVFLGGFC